MDDFPHPKKMWIYFLIAAVLFGLLYTVINNLFGKSSFAENVGTFVLSAALWLAFSAPAFYIFIKIRGTFREEGE